MSNSHQSGEGPDDPSTNKTQEPDIGADAPTIDDAAEPEAALDPNARVAELEAQVKDNHDRYLRTAAELENLRKRSRKDVDDARTDSQGRILRELLPVIDNLERGIAHAEKGSDGKSVLEGMRLVLRQVTQTFERLNVVAVEAKGKAFDPNFHEAVSQLETADAPAGAVVEVLQTGYRLGERLLRPALVVVAKAPATAPAGANGHGGAPGVEPSAEN